MNLLDLAIKIGVDDQASSRLSGMADSAKSTVSSIAAAAGVAVAAAGAGIVALGKEALDGYAQFEQLEGGIDKLFGTGGKNLEQYAESVGQSVEQAAGKFESLNAAHDLVMQNAQKAYATAGMSANQYMEQVSGFSAALVNSLGGDTVAAAEKADVAMRAISDNVNTFGTDAESVSMAFQGFAKQNYTMLDNLKLGYGGTKTEMERLIADANEWGAANGQASDLSIESFADVVTAIDMIQQKQQIAGTTAREASQTIEGSISATAAAWSNLLTELGKEDGDIGARMSELAESAGNVVDNVIPRIEQIAEGMSEALPTVVPKALELGSTIISSVLEGISTALPSMLGAMADALASLIDSMSDMFVDAVESLTGGDIDSSMLEVGAELVGKIGSAIEDNAPAVLDALGTLVGFMADGLVDLMPQVYEGAWGIVDGIASTLTENGPSLLSAAGEFFGNIMSGLADALPDIVTAVVNGILGLIDIVIQNGPSMLVAAGEFILNVLTAIIQNLPGILAALVSGIGQLVAGVIERAPEMLAAGAELIGGLLLAIGNALPGILAGLADLVLQGVSSIGGFVGDMLQAGADLVQGLIDGILNNITGVADAIMGGLQNAVDSALAFLGIASPSKLFREIGEFTMMGFADGIKGMSWEAERAMRDAADAVYGAAQGSVEFTASYGGAAALAGAGVVNNYTINSVSYLPGTAVAEAVEVVFDAAFEEVRR